MLSKSRLTLLRSLRQKKFRGELDLFVAEGDKLVRELLDSPFDVQTIYATTDWLKENSAFAKKAGEAVSISKDDLARISSLVTPQRVLAVAAIPHFDLDEEFVFENYTLYLDGIRDPGNLGTIIRIADWFGIRDVVCSPDSAEVWNPKVVQASMGSLLRVRMHEIESQDFFKRLGKYSQKANMALPAVYGTFLEGNSIYSTKFSKSGIIVIGNESNGIRPETTKFISNKITIPVVVPEIEEIGRAESLNAAVATAIVCAEMRRG